MVKVTLLPADQGGCGHYRMYYPAWQLENEFEIEFADGLPINRTRERVPRVVSVGRMDTDVLVLQRPLQQVLAESIPFFQRKGITVIVDIDDDFTCLHPSHWARMVYEPRLSPTNNWNHLKRACGYADLVTCSTPALAQRHGGRGHAVVLPNCVPERLLETERNHDGRTVGWTGYTTFHPRDLTVTRGGVAAAIRETGARMLVVGNIADVQRDMSLDEEPDADGPYVLADYSQGLAKITVGIVPLLESKFNDAKSYLKGLEFAAVGVPFVASPTPAYKVLNDAGLGLLADDKSKLWKRHTKQLLTCEAMRVEMGGYGREVVRQYHTIERNAWRWAQVWVDARERSRVAHVTRAMA